MFDVKRLVIATLFLSLVSNHLFPLDKSLEIIQLQEEFDSFIRYRMNPYRQDYSDFSEYSIDSIIYESYLDKLFQITGDLNEKGNYFLADFIVNSGEKKKSVKIAPQMYKKFCRFKKGKYYFTEWGNGRCTPNQIICTKTVICKKNFIFEV